MKNIIINNIDKITIGIGIFSISGLLYVVKELVNFAKRKSHCWLNPLTVIFTKLFYEKTFIWKELFMETKTETKTRNSFKKFICDNINTIVVSSLTLAGGCAVGYAFGHTKGIRLGQGEILTKIV